MGARTGRNVALKIWNTIRLFVFPTSHINQGVKQATVLYGEGKKYIKNLCAPVRNLTLEHICSRSKGGPFLRLERAHTPLQPPPTNLPPAERGIRIGAELWIKLRRVFV